MKSGFVVILGRPNVGKSTLLNGFVGSKVSIVTHKPQTTRDAIQGVVTRPEGQIVFVDSPGIHQPQQELGRRMMREVQRAAAGCHLALLLVDATTPFRKGDDDAVAMVPRLGVPAILVLNKIDLLKSKRPLLPQIDRYRSVEAFKEFVPLSAKTGDNTELLLRLIFENLPQAQPYYPEDFITDQPERFLAAELIRERVIKATEQELPYSVAVIIDSWQEEPPMSTRGSGLLRLSATIYVERAGQKGIIIGARGQTLKKIGTLARQQMEMWFGRKTYLELFVKVRPKWRDQRKFVDSLDFHRMLGGEGVADETSAGPS